MSTTEYDFRRGFIRSETQEPTFNIQVRAKVEYIDADEIEETKELWIKETKAADLEDTGFMNVTPHGNNLYTVKFSARGTTTQSNQLAKTIENAYRHFNLYEIITW